MSAVIGNRGLLAAAMAVASSMPLVGGSVLHEPARFSNAPSNVRAWAPRSGRSRMPGRHRPAGAKLWRKATEGKIGVRW